MNLRAPKDTPARNAARTLSTGAVAALLIMLGMDPALRLYDQHFLERPWIAMEITLVVDPRNPTGSPDRLQETRAVAEVSGLRSSWVETERGIACGEQGQVLQPRGHDTVRWSWAGWFGAGIGSASATSSRPAARRAPSSAPTARTGALPPPPAERRAQHHTS